MPFAGACLPTTSTIWPLDSVPATTGGKARPTSHRDHRRKISIWVAKVSKAEQGGEGRQKKGVETCFFGALSHPEGGGRNREERGRSCALNSVEKRQWCGIGTEEGVGARALGEHPLGPEGSTFDGKRKRSQVRFPFEAKREGGGWPRPWWCQTQGKGVHTLGHGRLGTTNGYIVGKKGKGGRAAGERKMFHATVHCKGAEGTRGRKRSFLLPFREPDTRVRRAIVK